MLWMLSHKNIRDSLKVVIKTFFNDKLRIQKVF